MNILEFVSAFQRNLGANADDIAASAVAAESAVTSALEVYRQACATATHQLETSLIDILRGHAAKARALSDTATSGVIPLPVASGPVAVDIPTLEAESARAA